MLFYQLYIGLVETLYERNEGFYFRPKSKTLSFENSPVGINTLNCLRVTCFFKLFNRGVEEKLIRQRTRHRSNELFAYKNTNEKKVSHVSALLGAERKTEKKGRKTKV